VPWKEEPIWRDEHGDLTADIDTKKWGDALVLTLGDDRELEILVVSALKRLRIEWVHVPTCTLAKAQPLPCGVVWLNGRAVEAEPHLAASSGQTATGVSP